MGQLLKYSGITTKVRAMEGKLLSFQDYRRLSQMSSIKNALTYLKNHPAYKNYLEDLGDSDIHRGKIEKLIIRSLFQDFQKIYRFASLQQRRFLKLYYKRYEIDLLKYCLRSISSREKQPYYISTRRDFFNAFSKLDVEALLNSESIPELITYLNHTEYYSLLFRLTNLTETTLFDYEITLDLYYFSLFWKEKNKLLKGRELSTITRDYGTKIDMLNIQWVYRSKKYYHLSPQEIYAMTIPIHYKIKKGDFIKLVEAEDLNTFFRFLSQTYYGSRYKALIQGDFEKTYNMILDKIYKTDVRKNPYSIASVNTYLYKKEQEIDYLTSVLEGIRYEIGPENIMKHVGGELK